MLVFYCLLHCGCWDILTVDCGSMLLILPLVNSWLGVAGRGCLGFGLLSLLEAGWGREASTTFFYCGSGLPVGMQAWCSHLFVSSAVEFLAFVTVCFLGCLTSLLCFNLPIKGALVLELGSGKPLGFHLVWLGC